MLASLGLVAITSARERGYALRSRCDLIAEGTSRFQVVSQDGSVAEEALDSAEAISLYEKAVEHAKSVGLPWEPTQKSMKPQTKLSRLIALSREAGAE